MSSNHLNDKSKILNKDGGATVDAVKKPNERKEVERS